MTPPLQNNSSWSNGSGYVDPTYQSAMSDMKQQRENRDHVNKSALAALKDKVRTITSISELNSLKSEINAQLNGMAKRKESTETLKAKKRVIDKRLTYLHQEVALQRAIGIYDPQPTENLQEKVKDEFKRLRAEIRVLRRLYYAKATEEEIEALVDLIEIELKKQ